MRFCLGILLFVRASKARVSEGASEGTHTHVDHDDLQVHSHNAYHNVESSCAMDVELLCVPTEEYPLMFLLSGDPFFDWIFISSTTSFTPTPPDVHGLNLFIDQMFDSVLMPCDSRESSTSMFQELESPQPIVEARGVEFSAETEANETPQLAYELQKYGASLFHDAEIGSEQYQMARRLTEIDTKKINDHVELPFGSENYCLRKAFEQEMVSDKCSRSISMLENTFVLETEFSRRQNAFINRFVIYMTSFAALMILLGRYVSTRRSSRRRRSINRRVVTTVHNNPSIRKQVELEIGESIGHGARGDSCSFFGNSYEKKTNTQNKDLLPSKTISCEGVYVQIV